MRKLKYSQAINEALDLSMSKNKRVIILGLGSDDPKGIFGTTHGLKEKFGKNRVFDVPTAENSLTGISIGMATEGYRPVLSHQRVEFALLTIEQIFNQAAKWNFMSAGKKKVPLVIRLIIGRGWGQGPQHSQSLEAIFAHIPGLIVVTPSTASDAKGMLISSINNNNPVIFFEHRWLHDNYGNVPRNYYETRINKSKIMKLGRDISLISNSFMAIESFKAAKLLEKFSINSEVLDLRVIRPLDKKSIIRTAKKTRKILAIDNGLSTFGVSAEVISTIIDEESLDNKIKLKRIGLMDAPIPSTRALAKHIYPTYISIAIEAFKLLKKNIPKEILNSSDRYSSDQPDKNFKGPF